MTTRTATEARENFSEILGIVEYGKERVVLLRNKKKAAAVISMEDLELLEALEDQLDVKEAREAIARAKKKGEKPIPWAEARKRLRRRFA